MLSYNDMSASGSIALAHGVAANHCLTRLDVSHNHIGCDGLHAWLVLKSNATLKDLLVSHNPDIHDVGAVELLRPLANTFLSLEEDVKLKLLMKSKVRTYSPDLIDAPANTSIQTLSMSDIGMMTIASASRLALVLCDTKALTTLDVSMNQFSDESNGIIAAALGDNTSLTWLNYTANVLSTHAAAIFAASLTRHPTLKTAILSGCFVGSAAATELATTIAKNRTLTILDLVRSIGGAYLMETNQRIQRNGAPSYPHFIFSSRVPVTSNRRVWLRCAKQLGRISRFAGWSWYKYTIRIRRF